MTKKDYIKFAELLRNQLNHGADLLAKAKNNDDMWYARGVINITEESARQMANIFAADNMRFNSQHFLAVCRGDKALNSRPARRAA